MNAQILAPEKAQPIDFESARFNDLLDEEREDEWDEFFGTADEACRGHIAEIMIDLWNNNSAPQVFRDRAMIQAFNNPCYKIFPREKFKEYTIGDSDKVKRYTQWLSDIAQYQRESGQKLVRSTKILKKMEKLYDRQLIDQARFEILLQSIDLDHAKPKERYYLGYADYESKKLDPDRFPLLADILDPRDNDDDKLVALEGTPLQRWAFRQFSMWLNAQKQDSDQLLPPWLAKANEAQGMKLCRQLCSRLFLTAGAGKDFIDWRDLKPAIEYANWSGLKGYGDFDWDKGTDFDLQAVQKIATQPGGETVYIRLAKQALAARQGRQVRILDSQTVAFLDEINDQVEDAVFAASLAKEKQRITLETEVQQKRDREYEARRTREDAEKLRDPAAKAEREKEEETKARLEDAFKIVATFPIPTISETSS